MIEDLALEWFVIDTYNNDKNNKSILARFIINKYKTILKVYG